MIEVNNHSIIKPLVSTKIVEGMKKFHGEDDKWKTNSAAFETCMSNIELDDAMNTAASDATGEEDLRYGVLEEAVKSKALYILLNAVL